MKITLNSNREIALRGLRLGGSYEGLLNGLPTKEKNRRLIERLMEDSVNTTYGVAPYLVPPAERELEMPAGEKYPFGTPAALPPVYAVARFESLAPTSAGSGDSSSLVVVWFQDEFSVPPPHDILQSLTAIDWNKLAGNFEY